MIFFQALKEDLTAFGSFTFAKCSLFSFHSHG